MRNPMTTTMTLSGNDLETLEHALLAKGEESRWENRNLINRLKDANERTWKKQLNAETDQPMVRICKPKNDDTFYLHGEELEGGYVGMGVDVQVGQPNKRGQYEYETLSAIKVVQADDSINYYINKCYVK